MAFNTTALMIVLATIPLAAQTEQFRGGPAHTGAQDIQAPASLDLLWRVKTQGKIRSSPAVSNGIVYFGSEDGFLYAVNVDAGTVRWKYAAGGDVSSSPAVVEGLVLINSEDGGFHAVDAASGKRVWRSAAGPAKKYEMMPGELRSWDYFVSSPMVMNGIVYAGGVDGALYALELKTGNTLWKYQTKEAIRATPAGQAGVVYCASLDGTLTALAAKTGAVKWSMKAEGNQSWPRGEFQSSPAIGDGMIYLGSRDGHLYAVHARDGKVAWRADHEGSWVVTSPAVQGEWVYAGSSDGQFVQCLDAKTGKEKWRTKMGARVFASPLLLKGKLIVATQDGTVYVLDAGTGEKVGGTMTEAAVNATPALAGDVLYAGSDDSCLYAFGPRKKN